MNARLRLPIAAVLVSLAPIAHAAFTAERAVALDVGKLDGKGQIMTPLRSPDGEAVCFEFLAAEGDAMDVYLARFEAPDAFPPRLLEPEPALPKGKKDVFSFGGATEQTVSEQPAWGPVTKRGQQLILAATRKEASKGAAQISFDLYSISRGKRRYLAEHPENDSGPVFSPDGETIVFSSGRTGQGDLYAYSLYAEGEPLTRLTFEESGSELNATWNAAGTQLAYVGHLGGSDHVFLVDKPASFFGVRDDKARAVGLRAATRDLTPGWMHSAFAPSFSPDGKWVAFFMHPKGEVRSDLYVVKTSGGEPTLLMENVVPGTRLGPAWSPDSDGVFAVEENAARMNPILWVPLSTADKKTRLETGTQLNNDLTVWRTASGTYLMLTAQGQEKEGEKKEKRWRKIFVSRLTKK